MLVQIFSWLIKGDKSSLNFPNLFIPLSEAYNITFRVITAEI